MLSECVRGRRPDRRDAARRHAATAELVRAVAARDHQPVVRTGIDGLVTERLDSSKLAEDRLVPERLDPTDELLTSDEYSHPPAPLRASPDPFPCAARSTIRPLPLRARPASTRRGALRRERGNRRRRSPPGRARPPRVLASPGRRPRPPVARRRPAPGAPARP